MLNGHLLAEVHPLFELLDYHFSFLFIFFICLYTCSIDFQSEQLSILHIKMKKSSLLEFMKTTVN